MRAREARGEKNSSYSHTIVYVFRLLEMIDIDGLRRTSHDTGAKKCIALQWVPPGVPRNPWLFSAMSPPGRFAAMSSRTPTKVYDRRKNSGNPVCRFCSVYLGLKTTSIPVFVVTQRQEFKDVKRSELLSEFGIRLNVCDSKSKRSCEKCARQIFNS